MCARNGGVNHAMAEAYRQHAERVQPRDYAQATVRAVDVIKRDPKHRKR